MSRLYERLRQLPESDLAFVVRTVVKRRSDHDRIVELVRDKPDFLDTMLDDDALFQRVVEDREALLQVSPFLLFTILLRRARRDLEQSIFTVEVGSAGRLPVFDAREAARLLADPELLHYLAELLASFLRNRTVTFYVRRGRSLVRQSFSDLDIDDLMTMSGLVPDEQRFHIYRRIADLCLFLTGIFPEHLVLGTSPSRPRPGGGGKSPRRLEEVEEIGREYYGKVAQEGEAELLGLAVILRRLADQFTLARKPLNLIAQRYIPFQRQAWFGGPGDLAPGPAAG